MPVISFYKAEKEDIHKTYVYVNLPFFDFRTI